MNLQAFLEHPYIRHQRHPHLPYTIFNYTEACQFGKAWDEYTTAARGLVLDDSGAVIARPFRKFMNLGETAETFPENLPNEKPIVTEKLDGSLGILYFDGDDPCIATRGSFVSEQAQWATRWIRAHGLSKKDFVDGVTYLFEIIYPENRVVLNYGERAELVLLALIDNRTGNDLETAEAPRAYLVKYEAAMLRLHHTNFYPFLSLAELRAHTKDLTGREGYVLSYSNGLRVKIKSEEYVRLHKIISGLSEKTVFEIVSKGGDFSHIPDEWYEWANGLRETYVAEYTHIEGICVDLALRAKRLLTRKEQALYLKQTPYMGIVFNLMDGKDASPAIWKMVEQKVKSASNKLVS